MNSSSAPTPPVQGWTMASRTLPGKQRRAEDPQSPDEGQEERRRSLAPAQYPLSTLKISQIKQWHDTGPNTKKNIMPFQNEVHLIKFVTAEQTQTLHPIGVEATAAMVKRQVGEQAKQVRVEEVGAEGTAGTLL